MSVVRHIDHTKVIARNELRMYLEDHPDPELWIDWDMFAYVFELYPDYLDDLPDMNPIEWRRHMIGMLRPEANFDALGELFNTFRSKMREAGIKLVNEMIERGELRT